VLAVVVFLVILVIALVLAGSWVFKKYNEHKALMTDYKYMIVNLGNLQVDISNNNKVLSANQAAIDELTEQNTALETELVTSRHDIDELERIERERTELQATLERLEEYRGNEYSLFAGWSLNECQEIMIHLYDSYREFITENESEFPDLTYGDKLFLFPDFYHGTGANPQGDAKHNARVAFMGSLFSTVIRDGRVHLLDIPHEPSQDLAELLFALSIHRIMNITEDNIPDDVNFETIFDPEIYDCIHFSEDEYDNVGRFSSIDNPEVLLTVGECVAGETLRCVV
jgi:hypothetical protein